MKFMRINNSQIREKHAFLWSTIEVHYSKNEEHVINNTAIQSACTCIAGYILVY